MKQDTVKREGREHEVARVLLVKVGETPRSVDIHPDPEGGHLTGMQALVGGSVECVALDEKVDLWCNEEGLLLDLPLNRCIFIDDEPVHIHGDFFLARTDSEGNTISLDSSAIDRYTKLWEVP